MEPTTLALAAFTLAKPFLDKTAEGIARKVGEDIWTLIKKPFIKNNVENIENVASANSQHFQTELQKFIAQDPSYAADLKTLVQNSQNVLSGHFEQNINSYSTIGKQVNIQQNTGDNNM